MARTCFHDLPNEICLDIFDYLCPLDVIRSFSALNDRFDRVIADLPMKLRLSAPNKSTYTRTLKRFIPTLIPQIVALDLGRAPGKSDRASTSCASDMAIDLFTQSFSFAQFSNLRFLSLASANVEQLQSLFAVLPSLTSLRSLRLLENDADDLHHPIVMKLTLANDRDRSHLERLVIDTSPPFNTLTLLQKHLTNQISCDRIQLNVRCNLFFYPQALTRI